MMRRLALILLSALIGIYALAPPEGGEQATRPASPMIAAAELPYSRCRTVQAMLDELNKNESSASSTVPAAWEASGPRLSEAERADLAKWIKKIDSEAVVFPEDGKLMTLEYKP